MLPGDLHDTPFAQPHSHSLNKLYINDKVLKLDGYLSYRLSERGTITATVANEWGWAMECWIVIQLVIHHVNTVGIGMDAGPDLVLRTKVCRREATNAMTAVE